MNAIATLTMHPALDVTTDVEQVLPGPKLRCRPVSYSAGGGGVNVARAVRRLGEEALAIFTSGGENGARIAKLLEADGVAAQPIAVQTETRQTFSATETSSGNRFRFVPNGAALADSEWQRVIDTVLALDPVPRYLVASGSLPPGVPVDFYGTLSIIAADRGMRLIVDTAGVPLQHAVGPGTFLLKPNLHEVRELAGGLAFSDFFLEGAARSLLSSGKAQAIAVSMGAAGAVAVWSGGVRRITAPTVPVVSRTGAGDSMVAGIVVALARGMPIDEAIAFGVAAGSAAVMLPHIELCRRDDAERLYAQMKNGSA
jgi:6-phosphofructokinase 2